MYGLGVSLGPCKLLGRNFCGVAYIFWIHCFLNALISLMLSFVYRLVTLGSVRASPS